MTQYAFYFDGTRCTGCKTCVFACKDKNNLSTGYAYRKVYEYTGGETVKDAAGLCRTNCFSYYVSVACNHCDNPACVQVCPTGAMHKEADTGLVQVDSSKCIGCGYCHMACPYNAPKVDREKGHSVKCNYCIDLVEAGGEPACISACPARALEFGTAADMKAKGERINIAPMPNMSYTEPNDYITPCADAQPADSNRGHVGNPAEVK